MKIRCCLLRSKIPRKKEAQAWGAGAPREDTVLPSEWLRWRCEQTGPEEVSSDSQRPEPANGGTDL